MPLYVLCGPTRLKCHRFWLYKGSWTHYLYQSRKSRSAKHYPTDTTKYVSHWPVEGWERPLGAHLWPVWFWLSCHVDIWKQNETHHVMIWTVASYSETILNINICSIQGCSYTNISEYNKRGKIIVFVRIWTPLCGLMKLWL